MSQWSVELEPEVEAWVDALVAREFGTVAFQFDRLAIKGATLRMPHSRSLGDDLFELRFDLGPLAQRVTFFFPGDRRIVLMTVFRKQRSNERAEVARARMAMRHCIAEQHTPED